MSPQVDAEPRNLSRPLVGMGISTSTSQAALVGDIVHGVLEILVAQFDAAGCASLEDPHVVAVLKHLGGYSRLVEEGIDSHLSLLSSNPRMSDHVDRLRTVLRAKIPDMRQRIQALIARKPELLGPRFEDAGASVAGPGGLVPGVHPEVELRAPSLTLAGRIDLLIVDDEGCDLTDYKTGAVDEHHADQLHFYSLIWSRDEEHNPHSLPTRRLTLSYPNHDVDVPPLDEEELGLLAHATTKAVTRARSALEERPPPALPDPEVCGFCGVRQLCEEYWIENRSSPVEETTDSEWFDFEGTVAQQNGSRSWLLAASVEPVLLLRTPNEMVTFALGTRLRLLNLRREKDDQVSLPVAILTSASEVFMIAD